MDEKLPPPSQAEQQERLQEERVTRRSFLMKVGIALNGIFAVIVAIPIVEYLLCPARKDNAYRSWVALGNIDDFHDGETTLVTYRNPFSRPWDGQTANVAAYVRRVAADQFTVFAVNCAHLNCPVRWFAESQLFMCPCHGGVYYADGSRASGPPERGLFTYEAKIENGRLMINAGQMPTLSNRAQLIQGISPCAGTKNSTIG
jgi:menaquinol-cytochrome c reductase iron-sulfur subunit